MTIADSIIPHQKARNITNEIMQGITNLLSVIQTRECARCVVAGTAHTHSHVSEDPYEDYNYIQRRLNACNVPASQFHPFCFLCWAPYRIPGLVHPVPQLGCQLTPDDCPLNGSYPGIFRLVTALVFGRPEIMREVAKYLDIDVETFSNIFSFTTWLSKDVGSSNEIPNNLAFLNAYYRSSLTESVH